MRKAVLGLAVFAGAVLACASAAQWEGRMSTKASQELFDDAIRWSRANKLETGGCFSAWVETSPDGTRALVLNARESVSWRRPHLVGLVCGFGDGIWHTHWSPESDSTAGCNMARAADLHLIGPNAALGIVVCGVGVDSVIAYHYSVRADSVHQAARAADPAAARRADIDVEARLRWTCADESAASKARAGLVCAEKR